MPHSIYIACECHEIINKSQDYIRTRNMVSERILKCNLVIDDIIMNASHSRCV